MKGLRTIRCVALLSCFLFGTVAAGDPRHAVIAWPEYSATTGTFRLITYNVAGLPQIISQVAPARNMPRIAELLGEYDLALVQEDFAYHHALDEGASQPFRSRPHRPWLGFSDGLNQWSRFPFEGFRRESWSSCSGFLTEGWDCWAHKGFAFARHWLAQGTSIDVYNLHMDAGRNASNQQARAIQIQELVDAVKRLSANRAVIIAGDTNVHAEQASALSPIFEHLGVFDACEVLSCRDQGSIDRVLFRGSAELELAALHYGNEADRFVDEDGAPLSDHLPVAVEFEWQRIIRGGRAAADESM